MPLCVLVIPPCSSALLLLYSWCLYIHDLCLIWNLGLEIKHATFIFLSMASVTYMMVSSCIYYPVNDIILFFIFILMGLFLICTYVCACTCAMMYMWKSEDNLWESVLSFYVGSRDSSVVTSDFICWAISLAELYNSLCLKILHYIYKSYFHSCIDRLKKKELSLLLWEKW